MRRADPPLRNLVLRDLVTEGEETLTVSHSNQGEPYRETLRLSFERGASGNYDHYEHFATVELEPEEERKLRHLLNARHERRSKGQICT